LDIEGVEIEYYYDIFYFCRADEFGIPKYMIGSLEKRAIFGQNNTTNSKVRADFVS
jgi:hypothetical protein